MDLSDDSSRGSSSKSSRSKSQSGSEKSAKSKSKSCVVTREQIEQFCAVTGIKLSLISSLPCDVETNVS
jgi:hypothetical protein